MLGRSRAPRGRGKIAFPEIGIGSRPIWVISSAVAEGAFQCAVRWLLNYDRRCGKMRGPLQGAEVLRRRFSLGRNRRVVSSWIIRFDSTGHRHRRMMGQGRSASWVHMHVDQGVRFTLSLTHSSFYYILQSCTEGIGGWPSDVGLCLWRGQLTAQGLRR